MTENPQSFRWAPGQRPEPGFSAGELPRKRSTGRARALVWPALLALAIVPARAAHATSAGPQPGTTGAPGAPGAPAETTCAACHATHPLNPDARGRVELLGVPERYAPGARYALRFRVVHPDAGRTRWGFQLVALSRNTLRSAGELVVTDPARTQLVESPDGARTYLAHAYGGTGIGSGGGFEWSFEWVAPAAAVGEIEFYAVGNAANMDGSQNGDLIFTPSPAPIARSAPE